MSKLAGQEKVKEKQKRKRMRFTANKHIKINNREKEQ